MPTNAVDLPVTILALKLEVTCCDSSVCWEGNLDATVVISKYLMFGGEVLLTTRSGFLIGPLFWVEVTVFPTTKPKSL
jgi:hypothetical protein